MRISLDISLYPLNEDYIAPIKGFIAAVNNTSGLDITTNSMSTQIRGESDIIFDLLKSEVPKVFEENRAAFIIKVIKGSD
ncbi:MAG: YkoF family thiamine/hydroxymethylpyrimidine-binding protein [Candidatus Kapaibacterium sp.]